MPGYDGQTAELKKLLAAAPPPPVAFRNKIMKKGGAREPSWSAYIKQRTAWVDTVRTAGGSFKAAGALRKAQHPVTPSALSSRHYSRADAPLKRPHNTSKTARADAAAIARLIDDLAEKRCQPLHAEIARLKRFEKKYLALRKLLSEDKQ